MPRQAQSIKSKEAGLQSVHFGRFDGIRNNCPRTDIKPTELAAAVNVDIDRNGLLSRRSGFTLAVPGAIHSVSPDGALCVSGGILYSIAQDNSFTPLATVGDAPMSYAFGGDENTYFTNGQIIGFVHAGEAFEFLPPVDEYKAMPSPGQLVGYFNMSLFIAVDNILYYTDATQHNSIDTRNAFFQFASRILMVAVVDDGIFVSDQEQVWWLGNFTLANASTGALQCQWKQVFVHPALEGTMTYVDSKVFGKRKEDIQGNPIYGITVVFNTPRGLCFGTKNGVVGNLTARKYIGPTGAKGASVFRRGEINQFISVVL